MHSTRSTIIPLVAILAAATTVSAFEQSGSALAVRDADLDDALLEFYARDAYPYADAEADPNFKSFIHGLGKGLKKGLKFAGKAADVAGKVAPLVARRDLEQEDVLFELYAREALADPDADPSFKGFIHGLGKGLKKGLSFAGKAADVATKVAPLVARRGLAEDEVLADIYVREAEAEARNLSPYLPKSITTRIKNGGWGGPIRNQASQVGLPPMPVRRAAQEEVLAELYAREADAEADPEAWFELEEEW